MTFYRVVFRDMTVGAWEISYEEALKTAKFFRGRVEVWNTVDNTYKLLEWNW